MSMFEIHFDTPSFSRRLQLFQSIGQLIKYISVMFPVMAILIAIAIYLNMENPAWALIGAILGSLVHLFIMFPAKLCLKGKSLIDEEKIIREWIERNGYFEKENGVYKCISKIFSYDENYFIIKKFDYELIVLGPEFQLYKIRKYLKNTLDCSEGTSINAAA